MVLRGGALSRPVRSRGGVAPDGRGEPAIPRPRRSPLLDGVLGSDGRSARRRLDVAPARDRARPALTRVGAQRRGPRVVARAAVGA